jgi:hypothetical protein
MALSPETLLAVTALGHLLNDDHLTCRCAEAGGGDNSPNLRR